MADNDFTSRIQQIVIDGLEESIKNEDDELGFMTGQNDMTSKLLGEMDNLLAEGLELPPEALEQIEALKNMNTHMFAVEAAMKSGDRDAANALMEQMATENAAMMPAYEPNPEIFDAIEMGDLEAVKTCLETWDVNAGHGEYSCTALYHAVSNCGFDPSFDIMHALLDANANPNLGLGTTSNVLNGIGFGVYEQADVDNLTTLIQRCVSLGADLEQRSENLNWTPLHTAMMEGNEPATEAFLRAGADANASTAAQAGGFTAGKTCLHMAISTPKIFELLLDHGADPYAVDAYGRSVSAVLTEELQISTDDDFTSILKQSEAILTRSLTKH